MLLVGTHKEGRTEARETPGGGLPRRLPQAKLVAGPASCRPVGPEIDSRPEVLLRLVVFPHADRQTGPGGVVAERLEAPPVLAGRLDVRVVEEPLRVEALLPQSFERVYGARPAADVDEQRLSGPADVAAGRPCGVGQLVPPRFIPQAGPRQPARRLAPGRGNPAEVAVGRFRENPTPGGAVDES